MEKIAIPTTIYSGDDSLSVLKTIKQATVLLVCDPFLPGTPGLKSIQTQIDDSNQTTVFSDVKPNPPLTNIMAGVKIFNQIKPQYVIAVGGGSAIDTAKAIRFFGERLNQTEIKCFIAIPTTSGTGSEVTNTAVVSDEKNASKTPIIKDHLTPDIALLDPKLVMSAPASVTAFSGLDVLTHALESLVSVDPGANVISTALSEEAIDIIVNHLVTCYKQPDNYEARKIVHEASNAAGMAFNTAGLGIAHSIAHQLGAQFHLPHGLACAMMLPIVIEFNAQDHKVRDKYVKAAVKAGIGNRNLSPRLEIKRLQNTIYKMMDQMKCPHNLRAFGVDPAEAKAKTEVVVKAARADGTFPGNPIVPTDEQLTKVYQAVIG